MFNRLIPAVTVLLLAAFAAQAAGPGDTPGTGTPPGLPGFGAPGQQQATFGDSRDQVVVSAEVAHEQVPAGSQQLIAVIFDIADGWHIWTDERDIPEQYAAFDGAQHTSISVTVEPAGAVNTEQLAIQWPEIHGVTANLGLGAETYAVFEGKSIAYVVIDIPDDAPTGSVTLSIDAYIQSCDATTCLMPASAENQVVFEIVPAAAASTTVPIVPDTDTWRQYKQDEAVAAAPPITEGDDNVKFDFFGIITFDLNAAGAGFFLLLLVSALGGFILNFTPCVLPVIPLKIMGLSSAAGSRRRTLFLGTIMSLGVVTLWLIIGAGLAAVAGFTSTNQLFQYPVFNISIGLFIALMAVGMCGLFAIRLPRFVYGINPSHERPGGSFMFGIMTGILALPCIGPFMGAAAAFAANLAPVQTLSVFLAIGVGMALPYQVLSTFPHLVERMPRTGPASELIKQVMGLLMLAAAAYFVGTGLSGFLADPPQPPSRFYMWIVAVFAVAAGLWMLWRTIRITKKWPKRVFFGGIGALIAAISVYIGVATTRPGPIDWVYYTPERFTEAKQNGKVVVMEFTAEWCINCKALEAGVLHTDRMVDLLDDEDIVPIKVDLTGNNKTGNEMLKAVDRVGIPLLVVFGPDGREVFKGDFYTVDQVLNAVNEARTGNVVASRHP